MSKQCCGNCGHWAEHMALKTPIGRFGKGTIAKCEWPIPVQTFPESYRKHMNSPISLSYMEPTDGQECQCWTPRAKDSP